MKQLLCETISGSEADIRVLTEAEVQQRGLPKRKGVLGYASGTFSVCDELNKNKRLYEIPLWEGVHNSDRFKGMLDGMTLLGEPDHPETRTQSSIREGSHTIVEQRLDRDKRVRGTVAVFDNPLGQIVWPMLEAGVKLGFSTRGDGDLLEDSRSGGSRVDPESYEYHGVDFVLNPSFVEAVPESITEQQAKRVKTALTEAAGKVDDATRRNVQAILEAVEPKKEEKDDSNKPLEAALAQLTEAKLRVAELEAQLAENNKVAEQVEKQTSETEGKERVRRQMAEADRDRLTVEVGQLTESLAKLKGRKGKADVAKVVELKRVMEANQRSHLKLASSHRELKAEHDETAAAYGKGLKVIEALRAKLADAEQRLQESERKLQESDEQLAQARGRLEESERALPGIKQLAVIETYKRLRTAGVEVPEQVRPLLERAGTEDEVDELVELIESSEASRYGHLPLRNSRGIRGLLGENGVEVVREDAESERQESDDARDVRKAVAAQYGRR
jgi:DNA repair exonuclease SbcCD ATPase subunit